MKKYAFILTAFFLVPYLSSTLFAQNDSTKLTKEQKKEQKQKAEAADWNQAKALAEGKRIVFTATQLFTNGGSAGLNPNLNFLSVIDDQAVLQFGFEGVIIGGNGVGGFTPQGMVTKYEVVADNPKKPVQIYINFDPLAAQGRGIGNFYITIYNEGYAELDFSASGLRMNGSASPMSAPSNAVTPIPIPTPISSTMRA